MEKAKIISLPQKAKPLPGMPGLVIDETSDRAKMTKNLELKNLSRPEISNLAKDTVILIYDKKNDCDTFCVLKQDEKGWYFEVYELKTVYLNFNVEDVKAPKTGAFKNRFKSLEEFCLYFENNKKEMIFGAYEAYGANE